MIFDGLFGNRNDEQKAEGGKFERHRNIVGSSGPVGPVGVLCGGFGEEELEVLAETIERVWMGPEGVVMQHIPIAVLSRSDVQAGTTLEQMLTKLSERDSVIPDDALELASPFVLLSGFSPLQVSATMKAILASGIRGGTQIALPMCAVAVPKALGKSMTQLLDELEADHAMQ